MAASNVAAWKPFSSPNLLSDCQGSISGRDSDIELVVRCKCRPLSAPCTFCLRCLTERVLVLIRTSMESPSSAAMSSDIVTSPRRRALAPLDANTPRVGKEAKPTLVKRISAALHRKTTSSLWDDSEEVVTVEKERTRRSALEASSMDASEASSMDELRRRLVPSATASEASGAPATVLETILQTPAVAEFLRTHSDAALLTGGERVRCSLTNVVMWADIAELKGHWSSKRYRQAAGRSLVGGASRKSRAKTTPVTCAVPSVDSTPAWHLSTGVDPTLPTEPTVEPITATSEPQLEPAESTVEATAEPTVESTAEPTVETNDPDPWSLVDEEAVH